MTEEALTQYILSAKLLSVVFSNFLSPLRNYHFFRMGEAKIILLQINVSINVLVNLEMVCYQETALGRAGIWTG